MSKRVNHSALVPPQTHRCRWARILLGRGLDLLAESHEILPEQWAPGQPYSPERQLWVTVLLDAAASLRARRPGAIREVETWIAGKTSAPMSFNLLCELLGLDSRYIAEKFSELITRSRECKPRGYVPKPFGFRHHQPNVGGRKAARAGGEDGMVKAG